MMMKNKTSIILLLVLILSNALWFWHHYNMKHRKGHRGQSRIKEMIAKESGFTKEQKEAFDKIFDANAAAVRTSMDSIGALKKAYIEDLYAEKNADSSALNYANKVGSIIASMNTNSYKNLMIDARKICKPEQLSKYDSVVKIFLIKMPGRGNRK